MDEYRKYLATKVVNEDALINYRQLSRALKVHTHLAKQMLYDFHRTQTARKPGSVHATYLLTGILRTEQQTTTNHTNGSLSQADEDTPMASSPYPSSYPEPELAPSIGSEDAEPTEDAVHNTTVQLVREEELEEAKADFEELHSIFVYSIEPGPLKDFQLLAQCNREVSKEFWTADPMQAYPQYGLITNKDVRRRTGKRPPASSAATATAPTSTKAAKSAPAPKDTAPAAAKKEEQPKPIASTKPAAPKRQSSDLFKSFAKSKPPKLKTEDSNASSIMASANQSPVDKDDEPMQGMSEDEAASDIDEEELKAQTAKAEQARKARKEREAKLKQMMDEESEDEEMTDADGPVDQAAQSPAEAVDDSAAIDKQQEPEKKEEVSVSNGRRRGRRKVMKKQTYKDEDGYLVTKEEAAWESFSEDEPQPKKPKINFPPAQVSKKSAAAPKGQGNLMNFFKKK